MKLTALARFAAPAVTAIMLAGCQTAALPVYTRTAPASPTASLTGDCELGYLPSGQGAMFIPGAPQGQTIDGTYWPPILAYELTLTASGDSSTADVNDFAIAFYDSAGNELGSDSQDVAETFLTPGQSLTWTVNANNASIPSGAATCSLVEWFHP